MNSTEIWNRIIERATESEIEIPTVPKVKKKPLWFRVSAVGKTVLISQAEDNMPSSKLKMSRTISFEEFDRIYPYYELRLQGEAVSQEAVRKSVNTVYIYGPIEYFRKES